MNSKTGSNDKCPCGSGKTYRLCCQSKSNISALADHQPKVSNISRFPGKKFVAPATSDIPPSAPDASAKLAKIHQLTRKLNRLIEQYAEQHIDGYNYAYAWQCFLGWNELNPQGPLSELPEAAEMFDIWRLYHWLPEQVPALDDELQPQEDILAKLFLAKRPVCVTDRAFIDAAIAPPYCYYQILSVVENQSMILKNLFTDQQLQVVERIAARPENIGDMIFTTVIDFEGEHFMLGTGSYAFDERGLTEILDFKQSVLENIGDWSEYLINIYQPELLDLYWGFRDELFNPEHPKMDRYSDDEFEIPFQKGPHVVINNIPDNVTELNQKPHCNANSDINVQSQFRPIDNQAQMGYLHQWLEAKQPALDNLKPHQAAFKPQYQQALLGLIKQIQFNNPFHRKWLLDLLGLPR